MSDDRRSTHVPQHKGDEDADRCERTVLDFVKRGKVRRGAIESVLNEPDDREPGRLEKALAEFARARAHMLSESDKQRCL